MSKVRRNITVARILQILFYSLGFPLILHLVLNASSPLIENSLIGSGKTQFIGTLNFFKGPAIKGIYIALILWVIFIVAQILLKVLMKKNRWVKVAIAVCIAAVIFVAPIMYMDFIKKPKYNKLREEYAENGVELSEWGKVTVKFKSQAKSSQSELDKFMTMFNLEDFGGKTYSSKNTDGSMSVRDDEAQAWYSPNGMYGDGYVFSYKQANKVLRDYYENKFAYEKEGKDIDLELQAELLRLESVPSSDWNKYKRGDAASSFSMAGFEYVESASEYEVAYGPNGVAKKYYLTEDRLNQVLSVLGRELGKNPKLNNLLNMFGGMLEGLLGDFDIMTLLNEDLSITELVDAVNALGLGGTLQKLIDPDSEATEIDEAFIFSLLADFSSYQSPMTYPVFYFIENQSLKDYAYARYYARIHGAKIGSVLVGTGDSPKVGLITLDASGVDAMSGEKVLAMLDNLDAFEGVAKEYFPLFALREVLVKFSAFAAFCVFMAYLFTFYIDDEYKKLALKKGVK